MNHEGHDDLEGLEVFSRPGDERTGQYEGIADEPSGVDLERLKAVYYRVYPDGPSRLSWRGLIYVRVRPTWIRYSDFSVDPPQIVEFHAEELACSAAPPRPYEDLR